MFVSWPILVVLGLGVFVVGTVVGSFLNVCIYRIPWEKSVIWPSSRCPRCLGAIASRDNVPILGWIALRGECRNCGLPISPRYPLVELLVGLLFLALYYVDVIQAPRGTWGQIPLASLGTLAYHAILVALLVAASFIDYDLYIIPDAITVTGVVLGLGIGTLWPWIRPEPSTAGTHAGGLAVGVIGLLAGAGLTAGVRRAASSIVGAEAMGFGDVTLMGMIGAFLGWQGAILTFFIGPFFGLVPASWKLVVKIKKLVAGQKLSNTDRELPFGPYLSMGAIALVLTWPWLWEHWAKGLFFSLYEIFWYTLGVRVN